MAGSDEEQRSFQPVGATVAARTAAGLEPESLSWPGDHKVDLDIGDHDPLTGENVMFIGRESPECLYANDANSGRIQPCGLTALSSGAALVVFGTTSGRFWRIAAARGRHQWILGLWCEDNCTRTVGFAQDWRHSRTGSSPSLTGRRTADPSCCIHRLRPPILRFAQDDTQPVILRSPSLRSRAGSATRDLLLLAP